MIYNDKVAIDFGLLLEKIEYSTNLKYLSLFT